MKEYKFRRTQDFIELKQKTTQSKQDDEFLLLRTETAMTVINLSMRKSMLKKGFLNRILDEKGCI